MPEGKKMAFNLCFLNRTEPILKKKERRKKKNDDDLKKKN